MSECAVGITPTLKVFQNAWEQGRIPEWAQMSAVSTERWTHCYFTTLQAFSAHRQWGINLRPVPSSSKSLKCVSILAPGPGRLRKTVQPWVFPVDLSQW